MVIGNKIEDTIIRSGLKNVMFDLGISSVYAVVWDDVQVTVFMYVSDRVRSSIINSTMTEIWRLVKI